MAKCAKCDEEAKGKPIKYLGLGEERRVETDDIYYILCPKHMAEVEALIHKFIRG